MTEPTKKSRADIRAAIFNKKPISLRMTFNDVEIELRQPNMETLLTTESEESRVRQMARMLIAYAYVPDTDEKVFDPADIEMICKLPWNEDMLALQENITKLTGSGDRVKEAVKNSEATQGS